MTLNADREIGGDERGDLGGKIDDVVAFDREITRLRKENNDLRIALRTSNRIIALVHRVNALQEEIASIGVELAALKSTLL